MLRMRLCTLFVLVSCAHPVYSSDIPFATVETITIFGRGPRPPVCGDIDGDGDVDIVVASGDFIAGSAMAWFENTGSGAFIIHPITPIGTDTDLALADIDGDGDLDIVSLSFGGVVWYENANGAGFFSPGNVIGAFPIVAIAVADIDEDGDIDVWGASNDNLIYFFENDGASSPTFSAAVNLDAVGTIVTPVDIQVADINCDGHLDLFIASSGNTSIIWFLGAGDASLDSSSNGIEVTTTLPGVQVLSLADFDGDGDMDLAAGASGVVNWYENLDANGNWGPAQTVAALTVNDLDASDLDQDGDVDLVLSIRLATEVLVAQNIDGSGTFAVSDPLDGFVGNNTAGACVADIDGDGDLDIAAASTDSFFIFTSGRLVWFENIAIHRTIRFDQDEPNFIRAESSTGNSFRFTISADLDCDGDADAIWANYQGGEIAWAANNCDGTFGPKQIIAIGNEPESIFPMDVDNDGDIDLIADVGVHLSWFENTDALGSFGPEQVLAAGPSAWNISGADIDGDGDPDVLTAAFGNPSTLWFSNEGNGSFPLQVIEFSPVSRTAIASDINHDGFMDVVVCFALNNLVHWYQNIDGEGTFALPVVVSSSIISPYDVITADIDGDGDTDLVVVSSANGNVWWLENTNGQGSFSPPQLIGVNSTSAREVGAVDIDADGDIDVVSAGSVLVLHENLGAGVFAPGQILGAAASLGTLHLNDLDNDGDADLLFTHSNPAIAWYETHLDHVRLETTDTAPATLDVAVIDDVLRIDATHLGRVGDTDAELASIDLRLNFGAVPEFAAESLVTSAINNQPDVHGADIDGDGDLDLVSISRNDDKVAWYENLDGLGSFGPQLIISTAHNAPSAVHAADVDGDGDIDVVCTFLTPGFVAWFSNTDGLGSFSTAIPVTSNLDQPSGVWADDLDCDGDLDLAITAAGTPQVLVWSRNDGGGIFAQEQVIDTFALGGPKYIRTADFDNDGDPDLLRGPRNSADAEIQWYKNDGAAGFSSAILVGNTTSGQRPVAAADIDGDGDLDVVGINNAQTEAVWWENLDLSDDFGPAQVVFSSASPLFAIDTRDMDADGDSDIVYAVWGSPQRVAWHANDGSGSFGPPQTITTDSNFVIDLELLDLDGDADIDVVTTGVANRISWYSSDLAASIAATADAILASLSIYEDTDDNGSFDSGADTLVASTTSFTLDGSAIVSITLPDSDPIVAIPLGAPRSYFVTIEAPNAAWCWVYSTISVTHLASRAVAEDRDHDIPLSVAHGDDITSGVVQLITSCPPDLAAPFGTLDFSDVTAFLIAFAASDPCADFAPPIGTFDFSDITAFLTAFGNGC